MRRCQGRVDATAARKTAAAGNEQVRMVVVAAETCRPPMSSGGLQYGHSHRWPAGSRLPSCSTSVALSSGLIVSNVFRVSSALLRT